jgi:hypothetical protein
MAKLLRAKGLGVHTTTVAKIEAGERAARIDEIAAVADLFEVSIDALLGRTGSQRRDAAFLVSVLADAAMRSRWQTESTAATLRRALADLDTFNLRGPDKALVDGCERACAALAEAVAEIRKTERAITAIEARNERQQLAVLTGKEIDK